jgi:hypothetical protein
MARLRSSRLVQYVDIDDSAGAICAALAKQRVTAQKQPDTQGWIAEIQTEQAAHHCDSRTS